MLRSTHKPSAASLAPLPPGWTEHKAPTGHTYYYHAELKESTYKRPGVEPEPAYQPSHGAAPAFSPYGAVPSLSDPNVANAYMAQINAAQHPPQNQHHRGGHSGGHGGFEGRPKPAPVDKPRRKEAIPGCEPWILVYTKYSRRFVYNPIKKTSYWRIPEKLVPGILELDKARIRQKATGESESKEEASKPVARPELPAPGTSDPNQDDDSEYEEVEVTDDEAEGDDGNPEHPSKRQRTEEVEADDNGVVEFTEADIAMQLQAMGEDYGLDPGEYDDGDEENWPEGAEGVPLSEDDSKFLFKDLLNDFNINPYSPWEKLLEEGKIVDDLRYTALGTTKARKECWDEWSREKIAELKEQRAQQEKKDPRIAYMAFLQEKANPKLYWPEFKRKFKREPPMKDLHLSDKDREKAYREHINRLKMPQTTLKSDLTALLKAQPISLLNNKSLSTGLPTQILVDPRYISLEPKVRDPQIEAYVSNLAPPPEDLQAAKDDEEKKKQREAREKRERALEERSRVVEEQRRKREKDVNMSKARLREEERELEMAMRVGKQGLQSQLASMKQDEAKGDEIQDAQ
ncbi:hypothetical protein EDB81DRAFT_683497 [Dactylonectria macrodidyma]|uniref:WW domain-containing protein n=1 Tax=Dactylonectria macrodidyma TaxID=307937 RepID=A0A9P9JHF3_9HYPO|nr:hypothetical protein EDB81DRAFT_683497 [Dactylonectria macrodidyma]